MIERETANTLPWSVQSMTDENHSYYDVLATEATEQGGTKTCCKLTCDGFTWYFSFSTRDCYPGGYSCEHCTYLCVGGYLNCPVGSTRLSINE